MKRFTIPELIRRDGKYFGGAPGKTIVTIRFADGKEYKFFAGSIRRRGPVFSETGELTISNVDECAAPAARGGE